MAICEEAAQTFYCQNQLLLELVIIPAVAAACVVLLLIFIPKLVRQRLR